jgi:hypothetical protein
MERHFRAVLMVALAVAAGSISGQRSVRAAGEERLPVDPSAVFVTAPPELSDEPPYGSTLFEPLTSASPANFNTGPGYLVGPTKTLTTTGPEAEEQIAIDPIEDRKRVAAIIDYSHGDAITKYVASLDGGATWKEKFVPVGRGWLPMTQDATWQVAGDPMLAIDRRHNVYLADLYFNRTNSANGLYVSVAKIDDAFGVTFSVTNTFVVATNLSRTSRSFEDKPWIAADNSTSLYKGNVYVAWTRFVDNFRSNMILVSRSTNAGRNWSPPVQINLPSQNGAVQGSQVAVGPGGQIYVVYEVFFAGGLCQHFLARSTNGGASFTTPVAITPFFNDLTFASIYRKNSFAALAVSPTDGSAHVVYADQPNNNLGAQIEYVHSTDGGATFTAPVAINDRSAGQRFFPAITVDPRGGVHASWFDTRRSPADSTFYDVFATHSADGGFSFDPNSRVTAALLKAGSFLGDYAGIAAASDAAFPVWTSGGFNQGRLQTASLRLH